MLDLLSWLPSAATLLHLAPLALTVGGGASAALGLVSRFVPWLRTAFLVAPWVLLIAAVMVVFWYRDEYVNCQAATAQANLNAQIAVNEAATKADVSSDRISVQEGQQADQRADTKYVFIDRIINDPHPPSSECKPSGGDVAASQYLRSTITTRPAGGPKAAGQPAQRVP